MPRPRIHIGISGWRYAPWRGVFYPKDLAQKRELHFASRALPTIEINSTFYGLQKPTSYAAWYAATPAGFVFSLKGSRYITHLQRLHEIEAPLARFLGSGLLGLREKLAPILWQFPPNFRFDAERMDAFFRLLPRDTDAAEAFVREHDSSGEAALPGDRKRPLRHAVEIRNTSFESEEFVALLREHGIALVVADTAGKWPYKEDLTADFVYVRLHGDKEIYASGYSEEALQRWAERIRAWSSGTQPDDARLITEEPPPRRATRDVFCYFDNDIKVRAPFDAARLLMLLGLPQGLIDEDRPDDDAGHDARQSA